MASTGAQWSTGRRGIPINRQAIFAGGQLPTIEGLIEAETRVAGASFRTWYHTNHSQLPSRVSRFLDDDLRGNRTTCGGTSGWENAGLEFKAIRP